MHLGAHTVRSQELAIHVFVYGYFVYKTNNAYNYMKYFIYSLRIGGEIMAKGYGYVLGKLHAKSGTQTARFAWRNIG